MTGAAFPVITTNPEKADEVWLGTASGGLWHTRNALDPNPLWSSALDGSSFFQSNSIGAIAVSSCVATGGEICSGSGESCGCSVIWVGTGENGRRRDTHYGAGVYRFARRGSGEFFTHRFEPVAGTPDSFRYGNVIVHLHRFSR